MWIKAHIIVTSEKNESIIIFKFILPELKSCLLQKERLEFVSKIKDTRNNHFEKRLS